LLSQDNYTTVDTAINFLLLTIKNMSCFIDAEAKEDSKSEPSLTCDEELSGDSFDELADHIQHARELEDDPLDLDDKWDDEDSDQELASAGPLDRRSRFWMTTIFKRQDDLKKEWKHFVAQYCQYCCICQEHSNSAGRDHMHCYLEFNDRKSMKFVKGLFGARNPKCIIPVAPNRARKYCFDKYDDPDKFDDKGQWSVVWRNEYGTWTPKDGGNHPKKQNNKEKSKSVPELLDFLEQEIKAGSSWFKIISNREYSKIISSRLQFVKDYYSNAIKMVIPDSKPIQLWIFWGKPGTGKTRDAVAWCVDSKLSYYILSPPNTANSRSGTTWFCGYDREKVLIIDDFCHEGYAWMSLAELLRITDRYRCQCQNKGGHLYAEWDTVIITANKYWQSWYDFADHDDASRLALERRITYICEYVSNDELKEQEFVYV